MKNANRVVRVARTRAQRHQQKLEIAHNLELVLFELVLRTRTNLRTQPKLSDNGDELKVKDDMCDRMIKTECMHETQKGTVSG